SHGDILAHGLRDGHKVRGSASRGLPDPWCRGPMQDYRDVGPRPPPPGRPRPGPPPGRRPLGPQLPLVGPPDEAPPGTAPRGRDGPRPAPAGRGVLAPAADDDEVLP